MNSMSKTVVRERFYIKRLPFCRIPDGTQFRFTSQACHDVSVKRGNGYTTGTGKAKKYHSQVNKQETCDILS